MGLQDRNYSDDQSDPWSRDPDYWKNGGGVRRRRSMVTTLIIINVAIFVVDAFIGPTKQAKEQYDERLSTQPEIAKKVGKPLHWLSDTMSLKQDVLQKPWNIWNVVSHGFAHASLSTKKFIWHIGFNMLILFFLGRPVEQKYGSDEFLRIYMFAIVVAGLGWLLVRTLVSEENTLHSVVGASGAVSAIVALFVFNFPHERIYLWGVLAMPAWLLGVLVVGGDMLTALNPESKVAWEAHLFGFGFGTLYFYMRWNFSWLKLDWFKQLFKSKPKLKVHNPAPKPDDLQAQADPILEKIAKQGEDSLTAKERKILKRYSESIRKNRQ